MPEEVVARIEAADREGEGEVGIWPENLPTVDAFARINTQWRVVQLAPGRLHFIGLDYGAVRAGLDAEGVAITPELWEGLRVMEAEARSVSNGR